MVTDIERVIDFYHRFSHATVMTVASLYVKEGVPRVRHLVGGFDPGKVEGYSREMAAAVAEAQELYDVIELARQNLRSAS